MILKRLIILHRYLGVVLGVIMTLWCASSFVMMYQGDPLTTPEEKRAGLQPLDLSRWSLQPQVAYDATAFSYRIETLNGAPVLRMIGGEGNKTYDLTAGSELGALPEAAVRQAAETYAAGNG